MKFGKNQKSGPKEHQEHENENHRQKINFDQNFRQNNFWEPDFQLPGPFEYKNL
tara:strand:+ start:495 stop:656 length:162 start_codon:yes stop_codon:yes gene_type:complete